MADPTNYGQYFTAPNPLNALVAGQQAGQQQAFVQQQRAFQAQQEQAALTQAQVKAQTLHAALTNPSLATYNAYTLANPEHAAASKQAYDAMDEQKQRAELLHGTEVAGYLNTNRPQDALASIDAKITADKAAGIDTTEEQRTRDLIASGPDGVKAAKAMANMGLAAVLGPEKFADTYARIGGEQRAQDEEPLKQAQTKAQTDLANAQAAKDGYITAQDGTIFKINAAGQPEPAPASAAPPQAAPPTAPPIKGPIGDQITNVANAHGASPDEVSYLQTVAKLESAGNPTAKNGKSTGLYQFHPDTFAGVGGKDINSVDDQIVGAMALAKKNSIALTHVLGQTPSASELYLAHQQGAEGAGALLSAPPEVNAIAALQGAGVSPKIARLSILHNGGTENMTAGQFVQKWATRYDKASGGALGASGVPQAAPDGPAPASGLSVAYQPNKDDGEGAMSPEAIAMVGQQYLSSGPSALQNLGQGKSGVANKNKIMNWVAQTAKEAGTDNPTLVARFAQNKANVGALGALQKSLSAVTASEATLNANFDLAQTMMKKGVGPTGQPWLDTPINALRRNTGSVDAKNLDNLLSTTATEYAKILTTPGGVGGAATSDRAQEETRRLINSNMTFNQLVGAINTAKQEAENRRLASAGEIHRLTAEISGQDAPAATPAGAAPAAAAPSKVLRFDAKGNLIK